MGDHLRPHAAPGSQGLRQQALMAAGPSILGTRLTRSPQMLPPSPAAWSPAYKKTCIQHAAEDTTTHSRVASFLTGAGASPCGLGGAPAGAPNPGLASASSTVWGVCRGSACYNGISNTGNTCYVAAMLQALYHVPYFRKAVYQLDTSGVSPDDDNMALALQHVFYQMQYGNGPAHPGGVLDASDSLLTNQQEDAAFAYRVLCQRLAQADQAADAITDHLFGGLMRVTRHCPSAGIMWHQDDSFHDLQLPVDGCGDICTSLATVFAAEQAEPAQELDDKRRLPGTKRHTLMACPPVLHVQLLRVMHDKEQGVNWKTDNVLAFEDTLDLHDFLDPHAGSGIHTRYVLQSVISHAGHADGGHWVAYVRPNLQDRVWYCMDDDSVQQVPPWQAINAQYGGVPGGPNAAWLVYVRESDIDSLWCRAGWEHLPADVQHLFHRELGQQVSCLPGGTACQVLGVSPAAWAGSRCSPAAPWGDGGWAAEEEDGAYLQAVGDMEAAVRVPQPVQGQLWHRQATPPPPPHPGQQQQWQQGRSQAPQQATAAVCMPQPVQLLQQQPQQCHPCAFSSGGLPCAMGLPPMPAQAAWQPHPHQPGEPGHPTSALTTPKQQQQQQQQQLWQPTTNTGPLPQPFAPFGLASALCGEAMGPSLPAVGDMVSPPPGFPPADAAYHTFGQRAPSVLACPGPTPTPCPARGASAPQAASIGPGSVPHGGPPHAGPFLPPCQGITSSSRPHVHPQAVQQLPRIAHTQQQHQQQCHPCVFSSGGPPCAMGLPPMPAPAAHQPNSHQHVLSTSAPAMTMQQQQQRSQLSTTIRSTQLQAGHQPQQQQQLLLQLACMQQLLAPDPAASSSRGPGAVPSGTPSGGPQHPGITGPVPEPYGVSGLVPAPWGGAMGSSLPAVGGMVPPGSHVGPQPPRVPALHNMQQPGPALNLPIPPRTAPAAAATASGKGCMQLGIRQFLGVPRLVNQPAAPAAGGGTASAGVTGAPPRLPDQGRAPPRPKPTAGSTRLAAPPVVPHERLVRSAALAEQRSLALLIAGLWAVPAAWRADAQAALEVHQVGLLAACKVAFDAEFIVGWHERLGHHGYALLLRCMMQYLPAPAAATKVVNAGCGPVRIRAEVEQAVRAASPGAVTVHADITDWGGDYVNCDVLEPEAVHQLGGAGTVDVIYCMNTIEGGEQLASGAAAWVQLLRPGGLVVVGGTSSFARPFHLGMAVELVDVHGLSIVELHGCPEAVKERPAVVGVPGGLLTLAVLQKAGGTQQEQQQRQQWRDEYTDASARLAAARKALLKATAGTGIKRLHPNTALAVVYTLQPAGPTAAGLMAALREQPNSRCATQQLLQAEASGRARAAAAAAKQPGITGGPTSAAAMARASVLGQSIPGVLKLTPHQPDESMYGGLTCQAKARTHAELAKSRGDKHSKDAPHHPTPGLRVAFEVAQGLGAQSGAAPWELVPQAEVTFPEHWPPSLRAVMCIILERQCIHSCQALTNCHRTPCPRNGFGTAEALIGGHNRAVLHQGVFMPLGSRSLSYPCEEYPRGVVELADGRLVDYPTAHSMHAAAAGLELHNEELKTVRAGLLAANTHAGGSETLATSGKPNATMAAKGSAPVKAKLEQARAALPATATKQQVNEMSRQLHCRDAGSKGVKRAPRKGQAPGSEYLGVSRGKGRWAANIHDSASKKKVWLGLYDIPEDAARAFDGGRARLHLAGNTGTLLKCSAFNFPCDYHHLLRPACLTGDVCSQCRLCCKCCRCRR